MWTLRVVGLLYLISGLWCALQPELAAVFLGFTLTDIGMSEFVSVYGGLQVGLAMAMILSSVKTDYMEAAIFYSLTVSLGLLAFRVFSILNIGSSEGVIAMATLETIFVMLLGWQFYKIKKQNQNKYLLLD